VALPTRWQLALTMAATAAVAAVLYWPTLTLPVLYDDLLHIQITRTLTWITVWLPSPAFGFYRPMTFVPLMVTHAIFGHYPGWVLHGIVVVLHSLNAALVVALAWRMSLGLTRALAVGLLFSLFPFSYQALYSHNVHPMVLALLLTGLHVSLSAGQAAPPRALALWALVAVIFGLSVLTHESAILLGVFLFLVSVIRAEARRPLHPRLPVPPWLILVLFGGVYTLMYRVLRGGGDSEVAADGVAGLWLRCLYLLQGGAYPFTWFAHRLPQLSADVLILGSVSLALGWSAWAALRRPHRAPLLVGWAWWLIAAALLALSLPTDYLLHGPRLLYLASVGIAWLWVTLLTRLAEVPHIGRAAAVVVFGFVAVTNWQFVRARIADYQRLTEPVRVWQTSFSEQSAETGLVLVNVPAWLSPLRNTYAIGSEFVTMLGNYLFIEDLVAENLRVMYPVQAIEIPDLLSAPPYAYGVHRQTSLDHLAWQADTRPWHVFVTRYEADGPVTTQTGWVTRVENASAPLATFGPYTLFSAEAQRCEQSIALTFTWQTAADNPPPASATMFVHAIDAAEQIIAQADGPPLGLMPQLVPAGVTLTDLRSISVAEGRPARVRVGVYDSITGLRFPALTADQTRLPDDIYYLPLAACR
jgi:hypothetical protein